jgi:hypothetical protein
MQPSTLVLMFTLSGVCSVVLSKATVPVAALDTVSLSDAANTYAPAELFRGGGLGAPLTEASRFFMVGSNGESRHMFGSLDMVAVSAPGGSGEQGDSDELPE